MNGSNGWPVKCKSRRNTTEKAKLFRTILSMKKLLILLAGFAFIYTVRATVDGDQIIEGLPVKVVSSGKSYKVFEQYPWEGHSSNYGPNGNRLYSGYGVGVGRNISRSLQCDKEIGFICLTSVGGKLMSPQAKMMASSFLQPIGMNTRERILE
jgi:hypothetical protein